MPGTFRISHGQDIRFNFVFVLYGFELSVWERMKLTFISKCPNSDQNLAVHPAPLNTPSCVIGFERKRACLSLEIGDTSSHPPLEKIRCKLLEDFVLESRRYW